MSTMLEPKQYYTVQEVAEILGVTDGRVRQWLLNNEDEKKKKSRGAKLAGVKFGSSWAISASELSRFMKRDRKSGNPDFVEKSG